MSGPGKDRYGWLIEGMADDARDLVREELRGVTDFAKKCAFAFVILPMILLAYILIV